MVRALAGLAAVAVVAVVVLSGSDDGAEAQACFGLEPFDFDTHEVFDNAGLYLAAIELAAAGQVITSATTPSGAPHEMEYPGLLRGTRAERVEGEPDPTLRIPPKLMKAIVWVESLFAQAHMDIPWGGVGRVVRSPDCGFGLGQITSGMENYTGNPTTRQTLVGTHFLFNLAETARMLAEKWNADFLPIAGGGDPASLEDWYYALWAYNGLAAKNHPLIQTDRESDWINHPLHPWRDPLRGDVWHCRDKAAYGWALYQSGDYTYPERIYGCLRHPPEYPPRLYDDEQYTPTLRPEAEPAPAEDMDVADETGGDESASETESTEGGETDEGQTSEGEEGAAVVEWPGGIPRMWIPVQVNMPDLSIPEVAAAFAPPLFIAWEDARFTEGFSAMDFPTSFPELGITTHRDLTPPVDEDLLARLLGAPSTLITGPDEAVITFDEDGRPGSVEVTVQNVGSWIAPFRIITSNRWLLVRRGGGGGRLSGGVAVGAETKVVILSKTKYRDEVSKQGHVATLEITVDPALLPDGAAQGSVLIEPLLDDGGLKSIAVYVEAREDGDTDEPPPDKEEDIEDEEDDAVEEEEEEPVSLDHRIVVPGVARDE